MGFAFAAILLFITLVGLQAISYTDQIGTEIQRIQGEQEESDQILDELRADTSAVAIELRDYLMASPADSVTARQRFFQLEERMSTNASRLQGQLGSQVTEPIRQLRHGIDRYRRSIAPIFNWTAAQRQAQGAELLRKNVVPERAAVLNTTGEIESLRSIGLRNERTALVGARQAFRKSMLIALLALLSFVFVVALVTSIRLRSLERQAQRLQLQTERDRENLRDLSLRMVRTQEDERRSISRELHDQVGQLLTAIQMQFSRIETSQEPSERNLYVREGKSLVYRTVTTVRDMAMGLRPSILDDLGLIAALEWQAREFKRRSGIALSLKLDGNLSELPDGHRTCLYRIVQEALTNCGRHADAKHVEITLRGDHDSISLTVRDDGKGFDPERRTKRGLGLIGVEERVRELGGKATIHSQFGKGTLLEVEIPSSREVHA